MILGLDGAPQPPTDIVNRLKRVDRHLGLQWTPMGQEKGLWAITYEWAPTDPRRERIKYGDWAEADARDVLVYLPQDCSVDEAYGYFINNVKTSTKPDVKDMLNRMHQYNSKVKEETWQPVMDETHEMIEGSAGGKLFGASGGRNIPKSFGGLDGKKKDSYGASRRRKKG